MEDDRLLLHSLLQAKFPGVKLIFGRSSQNVLEYPCIMYNVADIPANHANNEAYIVGTTFQVTTFSVYPGSIDPHEMMRIPMTSFDRTFTEDDIVHNIFIIQVKTV